MSSSAGFGPDNWTLGRVSPSLSLRIQGDELHVEVEVAGVRPGDLHLSVEDRRLTVHGERWPVDTPENEDSEERRLPYEMRFGQFCRTVVLPFDVDPAMLREDHRGDTLEIVFRRRR